MRISIPVSPYVATIGGVNHVVLSLLELAEPKYLRFPNRPTHAIGTEFSFRSQHVDLQTLIDLGMTGALTFSTRMKMDATFFLSSLATRQVLENADKDSAIVDATFAVGLNIGVFATRVKADANLSVATVASRAELNQASTSYQVTVVGAGLEAIGTMRPLIANSTGPFTAETLQMIGAIQGSFDTLLAKNADKLTPVITDVTIETEKVAEVLSSHVASRTKLRELELAAIFALERAYRYRTANSAAGDAPARGVNAAVVRQTYEKFLGLVGDEKVTPHAQKLAETVLMAGRI